MCKIFRLSKNFFPALILEKVHTEVSQGKSARCEHIICTSAAATTRFKNRPRPLIHLFFHHRHSQHICPDILFYLETLTVDFWVRLAKGALHLQKVLHVVFASNYVACIAGLSDRTTKGLQALHYTLSFLCKRGNKPPRKLQHWNHTASYKEEGKKKKTTKKHFLNPQLSSARGDGCQNQMSIKLFASWHVRTFKFVRQHCKLCAELFWFMLVSCWCWVA